MKIAVRLMDPPTAGEGNGEQEILPSYDLTVVGNTISVDLVGKDKPGTGNSKSTARGMNAHSLYPEAVPTGIVYEQLVRPIVEEVASGVSMEGIVVVDGAQISRVVTLYGKEGLLLKAIHDLQHHEGIRALRMSVVEFCSGGSSDKIEDCLLPLLAEQQKQQGRSHGIVGAPKVVEDSAHFTTTVEGATMLEVTEETGKLLADVVDPGKHQVVTLVAHHVNTLPHKGGQRTATVLHFLSLCTRDDIITGRGNANVGFQPRRQLHELLAGLAKPGARPSAFSAVGSSKLNMLLKPALLGSEPGCWISCLCPMYDISAEAEEREHVNDAMVVVALAHRLGVAVGRNFPLSFDDQLHQLIGEVSPDIAGASQQRGPTLSPESTDGGDPIRYQPPAASFNPIPGALSGGGRPPERFVGFSAPPGDSPPPQPQLPRSNIISNSNLQHPVSQYTNPARLGASRGSGLQGNPSEHNSSCGSNASAQGNKGVDLSDFYSPNRLPEPAPASRPVIPPSAGPPPRAPAQTPAEVAELREKLDKEEEERKKDRAQLEVFQQVIQRLEGQVAANASAIVEASSNNQRNAQATSSAPSPNSPPTRTTVEAEKAKTKTVTSSTKKTSPVSPSQAGRKPPIPSFKSRTASAASSTTSTPSGSRSNSANKTSGKSNTQQHQDPTPASSANSSRISNISTVTANSGVGPSSSVQQNANLANEFHTYREAMEGALRRMRHDLEESESRGEESHKVASKRQRTNTKLQQELEDLKKELQVSQQKISGFHSQIQHEEDREAEHVALLEKKLHRAEQTGIQLQQDHQELQECVTQLTIRNGELKDQLKYESYKNKVSHMAAGTQTGHPLQLPTHPRGTQTIERGCDVDEQLHYTHTQLQEMQAIEESLLKDLDIAAERERDLLHRNMELESMLRQQDEAELGYKTKIMTLDHTVADLRSQYQTAMASQVAPSPPPKPIAPIVRSLGTQSDDGASSETPALSARTRAELMELQEVNASLHRQADALQRTVQQYKAQDSETHSQVGELELKWKQQVARVEAERDQVVQERTHLSEQLSASRRAHDTLMASQSTNRDEDALQRHRETKTALDQAELRATEAELRVDLLTQQNGKLQADAHHSALFSEQLSVALRETQEKVEREKKETTSTAVQCGLLLPPKPKLGAGATPQNKAVTPTESPAVSRQSSIAPRQAQPVPTALPVPNLSGSASASSTPTPTPGNNFQFVATAAETKALESAIQKHGSQRRPSGTTLVGGTTIVRQPTE